ncbi:MAG: sulfatase-like hydrolase/transferase [Comamonadaceae bacterium]|nr:sulfatase-like hydrolase/transferase [Comamonadaceae bacterium]
MKTPHTSPYATIRTLQRNWILFAVIILLTSLDIILLEKKYAIFSGGFLQANRITGLEGQLIFIATVLAMEAAMAGFIWYLFLLIGASRGSPPQSSKYLFLLVYGLGNVVLDAAKYKVLSYFGDFISLAVLRNLGGGSVREALLYGLEDGKLIGLGALFSIAVCWYAYLHLRRRQQLTWTRESVPASKWIITGKMLLCFACLVGISLAARSGGNMRLHLSKITPYSLANSTINSFIAPEPSALNVLLTMARGVPDQPEQSYTVGFKNRRDNLVLVVSESTRADVLGESVNGRPVTPVWRSIAAEGSAGRDYYSHTGFTTSSLKAIFRASLGPDLPLGGTLFEILKAQGYQIVVLSGQDESFGDIEKDSAAGRMADIFFDARSAKTDRVFSSSAQGSLALSNSRVLQQFDEISSKINWQRPVFVYINLQAAHFPYYHPNMPLTVATRPLERGQISEDTREQLKHTYLNAVAYSDWATGQLIDRLKQFGVYGRTLLAVSGDHGESLFDDGILGHGISITEAQLHTLLVTSRHLPALDGLLGQTDLSMTLLQGIGAQVDPVPALQDKPVIQLIGDIKSPSSLGYVYAHGERLTINVDGRDVAASWLKSPVKISELHPETREYHEVIRLTAEWRRIAGI